MIALRPLPLPLTSSILSSLTVCLFSFPPNKLQHEERAFVVKFSAIEIYNEAVRDLLSTDTTPLRLLDDHEVDMLFSYLKRKKNLLFSYFGISHSFWLSTARDCCGESH